jgi:phenylalanyl-tRNA synthetase beta chain
VALAIEGLAAAPSPAPLRHRLERLGVRSLGLLVDLGNLVMLEQGQPVHAFDLARVAEGIRVRPARPGERLTTLDGVERTLVPDDLVIADARGALAVAGVMGGRDSEISAGTTGVLLESATFDPVRVRRTAARLGLRTEASARFEKDLDPEAALAAARRFAELVLA